MKQQLHREVRRNACGVNNGCSANTCFALCPPLPAARSIRSTLEVHLEQKTPPVLLGLESLPEKITLGQAADVWRAAVEFKRR